MINIILGDFILVWRAHVIWQRKWHFVFQLAAIIGAIKIISTITDSSANPLYDPKVFVWFTLGLSLNIATQVISTILIATKIYRAATLPARSRLRYVRLAWFVVESGMTFTAAAIVQIVLGILQLHADVILEAILAQLSAIAPSLILIRISLGIANNGEKSTEHEGTVLTTLLDTTLTLTINVG
ncbi:hypothetical protein H0H81_012607 [Sphagnurus paluster]|uniref:Uncharacterized protein n=1 Tax=Sphagnurus paluster TaxID=117069 RepID=A0A9P7FNB2_9AGAR|nr:hypothetical protein H0H81_012607 [Sphagnurus paluster]